MDREAISCIVRGSLNRAFTDLHGQGVGDTEWTSMVKTRLCESGKGERFYTCARDVVESKRNHGEWLYDVCWLRYGDAHSRATPLVDAWLDYLNEAVLIVESEWWRYGKSEKCNLGDIRDDFQKLLVGRACVRCMIWDDNKKAKNDSTVVNWLAGMMSSCVETAPHDFYLLARYTDEGFEYWHLHGNGTVHKPQDC